MEFEQTEQQLTETDFREFEKKIGLAFPDDFKAHYLKFNGGYPQYDYVKGVKNIFTINSFDSIKYGLLPIEKLIADYNKSGIDFGKFVVGI